MITLEQAIEVVNDVFENINEPYNAAWQLVRSHIEGRVVTDEMAKVITDEMVDRAIKARYEFAYRKFFGSDSPSTIPDHRDEMRAALQAALGVGK